MDSKRTPGPWDYDETVTPFYNDAEGNSRGGNGTGFYEVFANVEIPDGKDTFTDTVVLTVPVSKADACLIAAAPDLLEACEEGIALIEGWDAGATEKDVRRVMGVINIAIAKAKGIPAPIEASQADGHLPDGVAPTTERK